jgi:hypothetical protein
MPKTTAKTRGLANGPRAKSPRVKPAVASPPDSEERNHYFSIEDQVCDLVQAADLAAYVLEHTLTEQRVDPAHAGGHTDLVMISSKTAERLMFAAYQVLNRAMALREHLGFAPAGVA